MARSPRLEASQNFRNVATLGGECLRPLAILRIVAQQIAIVFQVRSAARGIAHHGIHLRAFECVNGAPCVIERCLLFSSVDHERTAAALIPGNDYLAAFGGQHASSGGIYLGEEDTLHASQQQPYTQTPFALRFHALGKRGAVCLRGLTARGSPLRADLPEAV
jgi:hypothetical protein